MKEMVKQYILLDRNICNISILVGSIKFIFSLGDYAMNMLRFSLKRENY